MAPHFEVIKSRITKIFKSCNPRKDYYVKIYEIGNSFHKRYNEKIQADKNGHEYILFKTDIYFSNYSLAVSIDEDEDKDLIFELKRRKVLDEELGCKSIKVYASKDLDYEISSIQCFINEFKDNKIKELKYWIDQLNIKIIDLRKGNRKLTLKILAS